MDNHLLSWMKRSDTRIRMLAYIAWNYLIFSFVFLDLGVDLFLLSWPVITGLAFFTVHSASGPFSSIVSKGVESNLLTRILFFPIFTLPCFLFGWPAEWMANRISRSYSHFGKGMRLYNLNMVNEAIAELEKVLVSRHDRDAAILLYSSLADLYFEDRQYDKAINTYEEACHFLEDDPLILAKLGRCHLLKGSYQKAADLFLTVMEKTEVTDLDLLAARCRNRMPNFEEAMMRVRVCCRGREGKSPAPSMGAPQASSPKEAFARPGFALAARLLVVMAIFFAGLYSFKNILQGPEPLETWPFRTSPVSGTVEPDKASVSSAEAEVKVKKRVKKVSKRSVRHARAPEEPARQAKFELPHSHPIDTIVFK